MVEYFEKNGVPRKGLPQALRVPCGAGVMLQQTQGLTRRFYRAKRGTRTLVRIKKPPPEGRGFSI